MPPVVYPAIGSPFHPGQAYVDRIRTELAGYLELVRTSGRLPWRMHSGPDKPDLTKAYTVHIDLNKESHWMPREEGVGLRKAYWDAMDRLCELENEATPLVPMMDF